MELYYNKGDRVRIQAKNSSSLRAKEHDGETVTIAARCPWIAKPFYELEEYGGLWEGSLLHLIETKEV
jgi:hypothetical protein